MTVRLVRAAAVIVASAIVAPYFDRCDAQPAARADLVARGECRLAAQVLRTGHPAPKLSWATDRASTCPRCWAICLGTPMFCYRWEAG